MYVYKYDIIRTNNKYRMYVQVLKLIFKMLKDSSIYNVNRMDSNQEIISRLKFIGRLKKGEKVNTRHMYVCTA